MILSKKWSSTGTSTILFLSIVTSFIYLIIISLVLYNIVSYSIFFSITTSIGTSMILHLFSSTYCFGLDYNLAWSYVIYGWEFKLDFKYISTGTYFTLLLSFSHSDYFWSKIGIYLRTGIFRTECLWTYFYMKTSIGTYLMIVTGTIFYTSTIFSTYFIFYTSTIF